MKNIQPTTPGFVLTSLSFRKTENKKTTAKTWEPTGIESRSIAKFDYCLPPEEPAGSGQPGNIHVA